MPFECFPGVSGGLAPKEMHLLQINILFRNKSNRSVYSVTNDSSPWRDLEEAPALPRFVPGGDTNRWGGVRKERLTQSTELKSIIDY